MLSSFAIGHPGQRRVTLPVQNKAETRFNEFAHT
jgi:hypothetical protein